MRAPRVHPCVVARPPKQFLEIVSAADMEGDKAWTGGKVGGQPWSLQTTPEARRLSQHVAGPRPAVAVTLDGSRDPRPNGGSPHQVRSGVIVPLGRGVHRVPRHLVAPCCTAAKGGRWRARGERRVGRRAQGASRHLFYLGAKGGRGCKRPQPRPGVVQRKWQETAISSPALAHTPGLIDRLP